MDEHGHSLTLELPADRIELEADPARLQQAIGNLLTNAAKYTDPGGVVSVKGELEADQVVIRVRDNGIGIPGGMLTRVFEPFVQGGRSLARSQGGLGIGLTLVEKIAVLHGGSVVARALESAVVPSSSCDFRLRRLRARLERRLRQPPDRVRRTPLEC